VGVKWRRIVLRFERLGDVYCMRSNVQHGKTGKRKDTVMQCRHGTRRSITIGSILFLAIALSLGGCERIWGAVGGFGPPSHVVAEVSPELHKYEIHRIGIIGFVNHSGTPDAGTRLASFFYTELDSHRRYEITPPLLLDEETELAFTRTAQATPEEERSGRLRQFVREWLGRIWPSRPEESPAGAAQTAAGPGAPQQGQRPLDAVLTGVITRYDDRQGNALLVDQPASVAYEAYLISARDGEILWRARFDETQRPLLDNLLLAGRFFKGGGGWQTNDILARIGLERVVRTFPGIAANPMP
jgi:hypothetical protein